VAAGVRKTRGLRVRLPLARLMIAHPDAETLAPYTGLIADEVNVRHVELRTEPATLGIFALTVNPRALGPRVGGKVQDVIRAVKSGHVRHSGESVSAAGIAIQPDESGMRLATGER
jgi:isoleucyl-tRNA synthetase